jgi:AraC family transcriptional regulator
MPPKKTKLQSQFHQSQILRAQEFIQANYNKQLSLGQIAREAGSSSYHFARLYHAYTTETLFDYFRRVRLTKSLRQLQSDPRLSVTSISGEVGYETPSAFNKVFKKVLNLSPREFRNLGKAEQLGLIYDLNQARPAKEITMKLDLNYDIIQFPASHYVFVEKRGPFPEMAPMAWKEAMPLVMSQLEMKDITSFRGLGTIDKTKFGDDAMIYQAGVTTTTEPNKLSKGLQYKKIKSGSFARFVISGQYEELMTAMRSIFKTLAEKKVELRAEFTMENYLTDPKTTAPDDMRTEILIPIA